MTDDEFIEGQEIADLLERSPQRVSAMTHAGILEQDGKGRYPLRATIFRICRWYREQLGEGKSKGALAKQKSLDLKNQILQEALKRTRGETVTIAEAAKVMADHILRARDKFLRIGNKLAGRIPYLKDAAAIEDEIRKECENALSELSRPMDYRPEKTEDDK